MQTASRKHLLSKMIWEQIHLDLYELIMALEEEYDVEIPTDDLESINTVGDVINFLKEQRCRVNTIAHIP